MHYLIRLLLLLTLTLATAGCTTLMLEKQGKPKSATQTRQVCPSYYAMTRLDAAALDWAFSSQPVPADACLALYYPKAAKDSLYQNATLWMSPLIMLSLPFDIMVDTLTLPLVAAFGH